MKIYNICIGFVVLLMLTVSMSAIAQVQEKNLVGWWLFNDETEETDNWGDIVFEGATIEDGQLVLNSGKWAHAFEYSGPDITELTLVAWVSLDNLDVTHGSALTLDRCCGVDQFCGIVYAERKARQWMPGSSHFRRTNDFPNAVNEDKTGEMVRMVITYKDIGDKYEVTGYRNDKSLGSFNCRVDNCAVMDLRTWRKNEAEAVWGTRHSGGANDKGTNHFLVAHLEETRIYNVALTEDEVQSLEVGGLAVEARDKLATQWGALKSK